MYREAVIKQLADLEHRIGEVSNKMRILERMVTQHRAHVSKAETESMTRILSVLDTLRNEYESNDSNTSKEQA